jgi:hypothetical protein
MMLPAPIGTLPIRNNLRFWNAQNVVCERMWLFYRGKARRQHRADWLSEVKRTSLFSDQQGPVRKRVDG